MPFRLGRYQLLATDYDDTLATGGRIAPDVVEGLRRLRSAGRRVLLVTGRELEDLLHVCPEIRLFERVVAENGAVLYRPSTKETVLLADPPPRAFRELLRRKGVPFSSGLVIVGTHVPHDEQVLEAIRKLGLELQVIFNKGAVMVLPSGTNKATGLQAALDELRVSAARVVAVGDAENDHALLRMSGCGVAVANAIASLKKEAAIVTHGKSGRGVLEVIEGMLQRD
jgi:hydroxymethylpyrimidine pyrophosphatase-like HAD family hydrolase